MERLESGDQPAHDLPPRGLIRSPEIERAIGGKEKVMIGGPKTTTDGRMLVFVCVAGGVLQTT